MGEKSPSRADATAAVGKKSNSFVFPSVRQSLNALTKKAKPANLTVGRLSLLPTLTVLYGSASIMSLKRKVPACTTPSVKFTSMLALFANGVPSVMVPADTVEL